MHTRLLQAFVQVAETLHFVRAAERLGIAQSTLSQQIVDLESELGVQLLRRDNRNVRLTPAGHAFVEEARALLAQGSAAVERVRSLARGESGHVRLGACSAALPELLPLALARLAQSRPLLKVEVAEHTSSVQETMLLAGEIDAGLLHPPLHSESLACEVLAGEPMLLALWEDHPLGRLDDVPLSLLRDEVLLTHRREAGPHLYAQVERALASAGACVRFEPGPCALPTVLSLVRARRGIAFVPGAARLVAWPGVLVRRLAGEPLRLELGLAWRRGEHLAPLQQLAQALRHVLDEREPAARRVAV